MKTKIEIKTFLGKLLFEFEKENNTVKDTLIEAASRGAYLQGADLRNAYLRNAYLEGAYLRGAYLRGADLRGAYLQGAKGKTLKDIKSFLWIIPEEGTFIAWKKCKNALVKISIPKEAKRTCNLKNRKCRAEFVDVLQITDLTTKKKVKTANGCYDGTIYKVGERTTADSFDPDFTVDCSHGIHFFITKQEALDFNY